MFLRLFLNLSITTRIAGLFIFFIALTGCQSQQSSSLYGPTTKSSISGAKAVAETKNETAQIKQIEADASVTTALVEPEANALASRTALALVDEDGKSYELLPTSVPAPRAADRSRNVVAIPEDSPLLGSTKLRGPVKPSRVRVAQLTRKPNFFERVQLRKQKYAGIVAKHARANGVPVRLAMAVVEIESSFRAKAKGLAGEIGLMQIMPRTARGIGYKGPLRKLYHPDTNIRYGMKYLGEAHRRGGGNVCGTILKYNAGHYAKRMNPISARYCKRVKRIMRKRGA